MSVQFKIHLPKVDMVHPDDYRSIREIFALIGDKWTIAILSILDDRRMRFNDIHRAIDGVSQRMLVVTLRNLERDGFILRTIYAKVPPRVEYELTDCGRALQDILRPVHSWMKEHQLKIEDSRQRFDAQMRATER